MPSLADIYTDPIIDLINEMDDGSLPLVEVADEIMDLVLEDCIGKSECRKVNGQILQDGIEIHLRDGSTLVIGIDVDEDIIVFTSPCCPSMYIN